MRKIIHVDMDAFYASIEQRDDPSTRGRPVVVAWTGARSVVCAASYEARAFGVRSAMPAARARRLCPDAIFRAPDFDKYRAVSQQIRDIFADYAPRVEPLSLDEAFLDVTGDPAGLGSATRTAQAIRRAIRDTTGLAASAGVASNKFLAKVASDWNKPNGLFVLTPSRVSEFLEVLPVRRIPGVGRVTEQRLKDLGVTRVGELRALPLDALVRQFGRSGERLHDLSRGIDEREVTPDRPRRSLSVEDTLEHDLTLDALQPLITRLSSKLWGHYGKESRRARTVTLKLRTSAFETRTRRMTMDQPLTHRQQFDEVVQALLGRVGETPGTRFRLAGIGLSGFVDDQGKIYLGDLFNKNNE